MEQFGKKYDLVALYSGGLDSSLAIKIMTNAGYSVLGIKFAIPFLPGKWNNKEYFYHDDELNADIFVKPLCEDYIEIVRKPKYGYGDNMNPCIDCKIFFLKEAKKIMESIGAKGIITGEVIGERPMSQNISAMNIIELESNIKGILLRPLSAKLLEPTELEKSGFIDREKLHALSGRSRKRTLELAKSLGIKNFLSPAGGCLLTDPAYSVRLKDAFEHNEYSINELESLKLGRHFRLKSGCKLIVGRNEKENESLMELCPDKIRLEPISTPGPSCFLSSYAAENDIEISAQICARYSDKNPNTQYIKVLVKKGEFESIILSRPADENIIKQYIIMFKR